MDCSAQRDFASLSFCLRDSAFLPCTFGTQLNVFSRESSIFRSVYSEISLRDILFFCIQYTLFFKKVNLSFFTDCNGKISVLLCT